MDKDPKILAIIHFLDFDEEKDYDRFSKSDYDPNIYIIDKDEEIKSSYKNNEFLVCTDDEADIEHHDSFMNLVDELGLESYSETAQEYVLDHFTKDSDWFETAYEECTRSYAEDIANEENAPEVFSVLNEEHSANNVEEYVDVEITSRLLQECLENDIILSSDLVLGENITEDGEWIEGEEDLVEKYCEHFKDAQSMGYDNAADWYRSEFGDESFREVVKKYDLIDWEAACEWTKEEDGRGNELNRWDGNEYDEEVDGITYYIYPDCDFEELESVKAEKEDIDR